MVATDAAEAALLAAHDLGRMPAMPAPLAQLLVRHGQEAAERRFAAAALSMAEAVEMIAALAGQMPDEVLAPVRAWALARLEQYGAVALPPSVPRALLRGLTAEGAAGPETALGRGRGRQAFREQVWTAGLARVPLLPLGLNCLPWNMPARWGFRSVPNAMEAFNPFALAAHQLSAVLAALEEGWAGYAPPGRIRAIATPGGQRLFLREDGGAVWNHHLGPAWEAEGFAALRLDLAVLARRFERAASAPRVPLRVAFLVTEREAPDTALAERLLAAFQRRARGGRIGLFLLHMPPEGGAMPPEALGPDAVLLQAPPPRPGYQWHLPAHFDTAAGFAFEWRIMLALHDALLGWGAG
ncbi:hypothetical protein [Roseicella aerolata]|uniref:Uncharacterized protein n=1 Tax=Roseicella aerolata TaxID=2883479 RepID=A0A9X1IAV6_9PROT|nr:hypothetical protein [Roseicella aerolata]MCB4820439.1 hypothetical protein [Roseicella aerolata]